MADLSEWTDEQKEIHRRLVNTPSLAGLYSISRNQRKSLSLLSSIKDLVLREVEYENGSNIAGPMKSPITVGDFRLLSHDFEGGFGTTPEMFQRLLEYRLVELYRDQVDVNKDETLCFNLNTCGINQRCKAPYSDIEAGFEEVFNFVETPDIFTKKYLIFPTLDGTAAYCTLVINPIGAIKQKEENEKCLMVHIGFDKKRNLTAYKNRVAPQIEKLMELFMGLYSEEKGYMELQSSQIFKDVVRANDPAHRNNRPYQLIHLVDKLLNSYPISDYNHIIEQVQKDYTNGEIVKKTREDFMISIRAQITFGEDKAALFLMRQAEQTAYDFRNPTAAQKRTHHKEPAIENEFDKLRRRRIEMIREDRANITDPPRLVVF
ncbi:hypothetical protein GCK72_025139 [Caenorhabditis remanei]|uniref:Uncharacterized protein n=1 Tax=Caenorhabditis remanei TaxID=31234 RepID=A0A6A5G1X4_CAERE|nr:hypothetical protein GCK72_025139 [Caenorhabditis remanei]KAF1748672.1 hypothetical protein GCK72_025139 [Caenorhabditis remanei]